MVNAYELEDLFVKLPRFKFEYQSSLNQYLKLSGLDISFSGHVDFSGIAPDVPLKINDVIPKTFI
jgi:serine protease inhibitor